MDFDSWCLLRLHVISIYLYNYEKDYKRKVITAHAESGIA